MRRLTVEKLRDFVAKDRAEAAAKGCPPPKIYMIGQNDKYDAHCKCAKCQAIARREGSESGPLVDYRECRRGGDREGIPGHSPRDVRLQPDAAASEDHPAARATC